MDNLKLILSLLPLLIEAMKTVEVAIPGAGKGELKLALVREVLTTVDASIAAVWPTLEKIVGTLTRVFNAAGVFAK